MQTVQGTQAIGNNTQYKKRTGCIAAKIGAQMPHRLSVAMPVHEPEYSTKTHGKFIKPVQYDLKKHVDGTMYATDVKPGTVVVLSVEDWTRHTTEADLAKWVCNHPTCAGKKFGSKRELLASHPDERVMARNEETHCYYALYESPAVKGSAEKKDEKGRVVAEAVEDQPAVVLLLSEEE